MSSTDPAAAAATRPAGHHGQLAIRRIAAYTLLGLAALLALTVAAGMAFGMRSAPFAVVEIAAIAAMLTVGRSVSASLDRRERGVEGERRVGSILDGLQDDGWRILHDVQTGRGNIDHVAIGPGGLLAIETKSHGGRRRVDRIDPSWLKQSYAQKCWLRNVTGMSADCLLVFSRAYLDRHVSRQRGVLVLPARSLGRHLRARRQVLERAEVEAVYSRLCRALDD